MIGDITLACQPAEFEPQAALVLGCNKLLPEYPHLLIDLVEALYEHIPLIAVVETEEQRRQVITLLCDWGLPAHTMQFICLPVSLMWIRDYGPSFVRGQDGTITVLDPDYGLPGQQPPDNRVPGELAALLRLPVRRVPLDIEGGNLLSNGRGLCLTTTALLEINHWRGYDRQRTIAVLNEHYGFDQCVVLQRLTCEITGHVDMFATFVSPTVVVVGQYDPAVDPVNADVLDANAATLAAVVTPDGPLRVVRIPMPSNRGGIWRTWTNVIYANGALLVPRYQDQDATAAALVRKTYSQLLPGWSICEIDASEVIVKRGALRCLSLNIPWLKDHFTRAARRCSGPLLSIPCSAAVRRPNPCACFRPLAARLPII